MISKNKLLKYLDEHINNLSYCMTDTALDDGFPSNYKKDTIEEMQRKRKELKEIRKRLDQILF